MNPVALAKARARARRRRSGAAMFIVAMTLAVLASVGIYALAAAAMEVRTSGNERQNTQTHFLTEYGVVGTAYEISASKAQWYLGMMLSQPDTSCVSLPGLPPTADATTRACWRMGSNEIAKTPSGLPWSAPALLPYTGAALAENTPPGSLGPAPLKGDFFVELTEPVQAAAPSRYSLDLHLCFVEFTATADGLTQPLFAAAPDQATAMFGGEGVESQRARLVAGPIQCPH